MEAERQRQNPHFRIDSSGRMIYGGAEPRYLMPCEQITDPDLLIGVFDNNKLSATRFMLDGRDRRTISFRSRNGIEASMSLPGKSAFVFFDDDKPYEENLCETIPQVMQRSVDRRDHLHLTTVGWIEEAGWQVWWAPVQDTGHLLHVRIVPDSIRLKGEKPTREQAEALCNAFLRVC